MKYVIQGDELLPFSWLLIERFYKPAEKNICKIFRTIPQESRFSWLLSEGTFYDLCMYSDENYEKMSKFFPLIVG